MYLSFGRMSVVNTSVSDSVSDLILFPLLYEKVLVAQLHVCHMRTFWYTITS